ncbi:phosphoenolpyruvate/phosphate translocator 2, chloroplastic-like, partial [Fagus crenata]
SLLAGIKTFRSSPWVTNVDVFCGGQSGRWVLRRRHCLGWGLVDTVVWGLRFGIWVAPPPTVKWVWALGFGFLRRQNGFGRWDVEVLKVFPFPATVTAFQFGLASLTIILMWTSNFYTRPKITTSQLTAILPLAVAQTLGNLMTNISLGKVAVSFTHTIKSMEPFFTVILSALFLGALSLRNKLVKSLLRDCSHKQHHEGMMLNLIRYKKPCIFQMPDQNGVSPIERSSIEKRIEVLREACEIRDVWDMGFNFR